MGSTAGASTALQGTQSIGNGFIQAAALRNQAGFTTRMAGMNNQVLEHNAAMSEEAATDAQIQGNTAANQRAEVTRLQTGNVRAEAAANGNAGVGSAAEASALQATGDASAADQAATKINSYRAAFGLQSQAIATKGQEAQNTMNASMKANQDNNMAFASMITGGTRGIGYGMRAAGDFYKVAKNADDDSEDDDSEDDE